MDKENEEQRVVLCLPNLSQLSFKLHNDMFKLFKKHYPNLKLQFVYKPSKQLPSVLEYKDSFPTLW